MNANSKKQKPQELELTPLEDNPLAEIEPSKMVEFRQEAPLMSIIEKMAQMPNLDLDRVERLFAMHQQMVSEQKEQLFNEAMAKAQGEIEPVIANRVNDHTHSGYADLSAIHQNAKPVWTKHGFSVVTKTERSDLPNHILVICEVRHSGGHKETHKDDWPLDIAGAQGKVNKTPIQAKGSTEQYARRYMELGIFDVAVKGVDDDGNSLSKSGQAISNTRPKTAAPTSLIKKLEKAAEAGMDNLTTVWGLLKESERKSVGSDFGRVKKLCPKG